jgi:hypothetical protein
MIDGVESDREGEIKTLPGASAGHSSMLDTGYRALGRQAPVIQQATAQYEYGDMENLVKAVEQYATVCWLLTQQKDCLQK